jgi:predicted peroxiredoxin
MARPACFVYVDAIKHAQEASPMSSDARELVVVITHGIDHELSSAGMIIALGGMTAGLKVSVFLTSSGVDIVRRGAADMTHVKPLEPLASMLRDFMARGGTLWACTPCVKSRGYVQENLLDGVIITGASVMHEAIKRGAATLSF